MNLMQNQNSMPHHACPECIAIASVPLQQWKETYDLTTALQEGTIFPELNKVFYLGGREYGR